MENLEYIMENLEIDLSRSYLLVKISVDNPYFTHLYIEDNQVKTRAITFDKWQTEKDYEEYLSKIEVGSNEYLIEYSYESPFDYRVRKKILKYDFSIVIPNFDARLFMAKLREEKINQILEE